ASSTTAWNPATVFSSSTVTDFASGASAALPFERVRRQLEHENGRGFVMTAGLVRSLRIGKAPSPDSSSSGLPGVGTRNPKSSASLLNDAWRMKCSVLLAGSQTRITV